MPTENVTFFTYLQESTSHNGAVHRVVSERISDWMLILKDGSPFALVEGEDWVNGRARGEREGVKFLYNVTNFAAWRDTLTEEQKVSFEWSVEDGVFVFEDTDCGLLCSIATGEPLGIEEAIDRGLVDEDSIVEVDEDEELDKEPIDLDDIDDDGGDDNEDSQA